MSTDARVFCGKGESSFEKNKPPAEEGIHAGGLFDLLFQIFEKITAEEVLNGDAKSIAKLFDRGDRRRIVATADDVIDRGLGHAA